MSVLVDDWFPLVLPRLPGCPDVILRIAVRESAVEFCRRTRLMRGTISVTTQVGRAAYPMNAPTDTVVSMIDEILRDDMTLIASSEEDFRDSRYDRASGTPEAYYIAGNRALVLGPIPDAVETLSVRCVLKPDSQAESLDDALWEDWRNAIAAGACAYARRSYSAWMDAALEADETMRFEDAVGQAQRNNATGRTRKRLRATSHFY